MRRALLVLGLLALAVGMAAAGAQKEEEGLSGDYAFGGSTTVDPIITAAIEEWKSVHPNVHISYEGVGSSKGIKGCLGGEFSLGAASREPKDEETAQGIRTVKIALDAVAAVVNRSTVTISNLTVEQLAKIYAGEITNWKDVGGPDAQIVVVNRDEASGTYETFEKYVTGAFDLDFRQDAVVVTSNGDMVAKVGSTPNSVGYCGLGYLDAAGIKAITLNGVEAKIANVYDKTYPVWRYLNVVYKDTLGEVEQAFVDYLLSDDGQAIVEEEGFIALP